MVDETSSSAPIRVVLADDHDILRQGLKLLLEAQLDIRVVGEARTGIQVVEQVKQTMPDVVVMDISMPEMDGLEACQRIHTQQPTAQILILTMHESEEYFLKALRVGATGYLVKKAAPAELCAAVRATANGGIFLYPGLARALVRAYLTTHTNAASISLQSSSMHKRPILSKPIDLLTPREVEVLKLVAEGYTSQEIAALLILSVKTVQAHRASIMEKLGLRDITHLVRFAIHYGLIPSEL